MLTTAAFTPPCCDWVLWLTAPSWISYRVLPPGPGVVNSWCLIPQTVGIRSWWGEGLRRRAKEEGWGGGLRRRAEKEGWGGGLRREQHFSAQDSLGGRQTTCSVFFQETVAYLGTSFGDGVMILEAEGRGFRPGSFLLRQLWGGLGLGHWNKI